jgi:hypothetical protein
VRDESKIDWTDKFRMENWFLVLKNDTKNDQLKVVLALKDNTDLNYHNCINIMMIAHCNNNSIIMSGTYNRLKVIKEKLGHSGLRTSLKMIKHNYSPN